MERENGRYIKRTDNLFIYKKIEGDLWEKESITSKVYKLSDGECFVKYDTKTEVVRESEGLSML